MEKKDKKAIVREIYRVVAESGITSHRYSDTAWEAVFSLRRIAEGAARLYCERAGIAANVRLNFKNVITLSTCKRYCMFIEDYDTGEVYGGGTITASFCGSVSCPWDAYDVCATWWTN